MRAPSRRALLAGAGAIAAGAGVGIAVWPGAARPAREALRVLDPSTFSTLAALADRVCPPTADLPSAWALRVPEKVDLALCGGWRRRR